MSDNQVEGQGILQGAINFVKGTAGKVVEAVEEVAESARDRILGTVADEKEKTDPTSQSTTEEESKVSKEVPKEEDQNMLKNWSMEMPQNETEGAKESEESTSKDIGKAKPSHPATKAGGMRINQNPSGPHLFKKSDGTTHHHSGTQHFEKKEEKKEEKEMTALELAKQEKELALQQKEQHLTRTILSNAPHDSKAFPSTYHPPEVQHEHSRKNNRGGMNTFQPPIHG